MANKKATVKSPSKLNKEECLAELKAMTAELEFDRPYTEEDDLAVLRKAVAEGRKALRESAAEAKDAPAEKEEVNTKANLGSATEVPDSNSIDIVTGEIPNVRYLRTFSKATHGDDFADLAVAFVEKHGGKLKCRMIDSADIASLQVRWEEVEYNKEGQALNEGRLVPKNKTFKGKDEAIKEEALGLSRKVGGQVFVK